MKTLVARAVTLGGAAALVLAGIAPAGADIVRNSVGADGTTSVVYAPGVTSDVDYWIFSNQQMTGCDAADGSAATVTINTSPATGLVVDTNLAAAGNQASLTFTACGTASAGQRKPVRFAPTGPGSWTVSVTVADTNGNYNDNQTFTYTATGTPNAKPTVAVTGVLAQPYPYDAQPTPGCQVSDTEDGTFSYPAGLTLSGFTGPLASYGLGTRTASCDYTDQGGEIADTASVTWTVVDEVAPAFTAPADQVIDATSPAGAVATWSLSATDNVALADGSPSCDADSGDTFPFGATTVTCTATDFAGNQTTDDFTITVKDDTKPEISGGGSDPVEATGPTTVVDFALPTATDDVDGPLVPICEPAPGSAFTVGSTPVTCTATDAHGNSSSTGFDIVVTDTTPPALTVGDETEEATGPSGAAVSFIATASDLVDGDVPVTCTAVIDGSSTEVASGDTFPLGETLVSCSATDAHDNTGTADFTVTVEDTTAPSLTVPAAVGPVEATGPDGAVATYAASATDTVDTDVTVSCIPPSGSTFALGSTPVSCTATDDSGNEATDGFLVTVEDTTPPALSLPQDIAAAATSASGATVGYSATAYDLVDGAVTPQCTPASGSLFAPGATTVTCTATDAAGNQASDSFTVTVSFGWAGFFQPVDNNGVQNVIKGGQSVPLKWNIPIAGGGYVSSLAVVASTTQSLIACAAGANTDEVEAPTSGATSLRYDTTANQYIYNWQSPKTVNKCYRVTVTLTDGSKHEALFRTK